MKLYFAPMEGITTYIYRNLHKEMFGGCDAYFAPFITPTENSFLNAKNMRDILHENNKVNLKVQCLASSAPAFVDFAKTLQDYGYDEVNLNLGCPSGTVVKKNRGAGAFRDLKRLEEFLDFIFENSPIKVSIKTRTGFLNHDEFKDILEIYKKYEMSELIIHPRVRSDFYKNPVNMVPFDLAYKNKGLNLIYNGDINSVSDLLEIQKNYPDIKGCMIGRGAVKNPAIFREMHGGEKLKTKELISFSNKLEEIYRPLLKSEKNTLHKLKEIWLYMSENYPDEKKIIKAIKKSNNLDEINRAINHLPEIGV